MKMPAQWSLDLGARYLGHRACEFRVWAPSCFSVDLHFLQDNRVIAMEQQSEGYFIATQDIDPGKSYYYRLNGPPIGQTRLLVHNRKAFTGLLWWWTPGDPTIVGTSPSL